MAQNRFHSLKDLRLERRAFLITLIKVDAHNVWELLELQVHPEQEAFVANNTESIVEAYTTLAAGGTALPFGIYAGDQPVGFVMFGYGALAMRMNRLWRMAITACGV